MHKFTTPIWSTLVFILSLSIRKMRSLEFGVITSYKLSTNTAYEAPSSAPTKLLRNTHLPSQSNRSSLTSPGQWHSTGFTFEWYPFPHCHKRYFSAIPHPIIPILFTDDLSFHLNLIIKDGHMEFCKSQSILSPFGSPNLSSAYLPPNHPS